MRSSLLITSLALPLALSAGCANNHPVKRVERPVNVTHEVAFGDYRRVFNTAYHILNRYAVIQSSSYRSGVITALVKEDTQLFDKTRQEIEARIVSQGDFYEVQCRVLYKVEQSEVATLNQYTPVYDYQTVASDPQLEVRLNNEIRAALSGGAWQAKEPLRPRPSAPAAPRAAPAEEAEPAADPDTDEVSVAGGRTGVPEAEAFDRLGVTRLRYGAYEGAAKAFAASIDRDPEAPFARYLLAQALFSQGSYRSAQVHLQEGYAVNPGWIRAELDVRDLYGETGSAAFTERLARLGEAAQGDPQLGLLLGYMRLGADDPQGALTALDRYLSERPDEPLARALRGHARAQLDAAHGLEAF